MNEDHIIAAILTTGIIAQTKVGSRGPMDAVVLYGECLTELLESNRPPRSTEDQE